MPTPDRKLSRRQRRLAATTVVFGALALIGATLLFLLIRPDPGYTPGEEIAGLTAALTRELPQDHPAVIFADVTEESGIEFRHFPRSRAGLLPEDMGSGAGWADYDGDGWLDLMLVNIGGPSRLYRNQGDGTFADVTGSAGIDHSTTGMGVAWADYDGDGWTDLFLSAYGDNVLYRNLGNGTFGDVTVEVGMADRPGFWAGVAWSDYDRDGYLDLYVTGYVEFESTLGANAARQYDVEIPASLNPSSFRPHPNLLWHNEGDGTFREVSEAAGVQGEGRSLGAVWADLDEDGWPDLYVANDVSDNALYRNLGNGRFEDVSHQAAVADYRGAMGLALGDWDGDEDIDLFITHWIAQENALFTNLGSDLTSATDDARALRFVDEADRVGLGQIALDFVGWGTFFFDYNHDGLSDLFVANGSTLQRRDDPTLLVPMRDQLFWNRGRDRGFFDVSAASGDHFRRELVGRGAAVGDYDRDGDLDIVIINHGDQPTLLRNEGSSTGAWLQLHLEARAANRSAIGARVRVVAGGRAQTRIVGAQTSYLSHNSLVQHFGLGDAAQVDSLTVIWPDGSHQSWTKVPHRRAIRIVQNSPDLSTEWVASGGPGFWTLYREGERHRIEGRLSQAVSAYEEALALNPLHKNALYYLASVHLELGDNSAAEAALIRLLDVDSESARAHTQMGVLYVCPGPGRIPDPVRARAAFDRASSINPEQTGSLLWLSLAALVEGDVAEAGHLLDQVLGTNPESIPGIFLRGYVSWEAGRASEAQDALNRALELASTSSGGEGLLEGDTRGSRPVFASGVSCPWVEDQLTWLTHAPDAEAVTTDGRYRALRNSLQAARGP